ncbi:GCN5-related N-acetyltransferase [Ancylobacter novellus DSM 506]|uniref:GCN5-related N-acetyltransferase n=1 Tax=Ancylobacter novellus (strain ATCC 8093 / DSM 506 / JCM 20403 / CCM 1077 / IAM 12100 / NBRC 12443 / NCIMB 10456) TaxID=639283 RepID=D7A6S3_ANCN5|nr:GNAT family N-acetyltransferase [Ancylobacter novellus]ADH90271.1 GCN5-related N-acetyltransferase [Ancylobacter novellus DSM 506]
MTGSLTIRSLRPEEIRLAIDWAAGEGWNPGLDDAACFSVVDPEGFLVAELDGEPAAVISVVNYDEAFAFLGFYIVRPELRGRGIGFKLWQAGLAHAGARTIGLDGVVAQQENYAKQGFTFAYRNIRFAGAPGDGEAGDTVDLSTLPFAVVEASDAAIFPASRTAFLKAWLSTPGHAGRALIRDGALAGWGVVRPARAGWKIGPLVAQDEEAAEIVFRALRAAAGAGEIVLDVPEPNVAALALARRHGLAPVFETARMYTGPIRPVALERLYGVTSFELG